MLCTLPDSGPASVLAGDQKLRERGFFEGVEVSEPAMEGLEQSSFEVEMTQLVQISSDG